MVTTMVRGPHRIRAGTVARAALLPAAALGVHQLRYLLAFGAGAGANTQLARTGHSYLHSIAPWIIALGGLAPGIFLVALGRALGGRRPLPRQTISFTLLWTVCAACLLAIFAVQEQLEGLMAAGHPTALAAIFGYGGWWAIPAAAGVGLVLAAIFHGASQALDAVGCLRSPPAGPAPAAPSLAVRLAIDLALPRRLPLAGGWSGRGPPSRRVAH